MNAHQVTKDFERELCNYTGAPYAVAVNSCTMALLLAVAWHLRHNRAHDPRIVGGLIHRTEVEIPKRTYVGVPMSIIHAGGRPTFREEEWRGAYQLKPLPVWDSARLFTSSMCRGGMFPDAGQMVCVSFHASKTLGDTQGGAILLDDHYACDWLKRARFDGRVEGIPPTLQPRETWLVGWHCYMSPDVATRLLWKLSVLPKHNEPLPNDEYPDLSEMEIFFK